MAAVTFQSPRDSMHSYRSEMSKARPKHTLFGTPLEALTDEERAHINSIDVKKYTKVHLPMENTELSSQLLNYENQKLRVRQAAEEEEAAKMKALHFLTTPPAPVVQKHRKPHDSQNLMELLNPRSQQSSQPIHQNRYQIMGDVFSSGKDFRQRERSLRDHNVRYGRRSNDTNRGFTRDFLEHHTGVNTNQNCDTEYPEDENKPKSTVALPQNIRHSFGSQLCDELLSDAQEVGRTIDEQKEEKRPRATMPHMDSSKKLKTPLSDYEYLGYQTRLNVFPGLSSKVKASVTKSNFSDQVFLNRVPDPDEYRMKRDELSTWAESNVLRERMKKAWDQTGDKKQ